MLFKINYNDPQVKKGAFILLWYAAVAVLLISLEKIFPTGPCTPGLGIILFFILPWVIAAFLIGNTIKLVNGKQEYKIPRVIHLMALLVCLLMFFI